MKDGSNKKRIIIYSLIVISIISLVLGKYLSPVKANLSWLFNDNQYESLTNEDFEALDSVYNTIQTLYIGEVDKEALIQGALNGMVEATGDPYSEFLSPELVEDVVEEIEGSFTGIGVQFQMIDNVPTIITPIEGTPASEAGLRPNDIILEADGVDLTAKDTNEIVDLIRGEEGTTVDLLIQRDGRTFEVTIERAEIPIITVDGHMDSDYDDIGYIHITQFNGTTAEEFVDVVTDLRDQGAERFVFDVRNNPGGLLDQYLMIANMFSEEGETLMQMEETQSSRTVYLADDQEYGDFKITEPYVFLMNEGSASASEILVSAVNENSNAPLIGQTTFGKGSVQSHFPQGEHGELKLTIARWLTPEGEWIHDVGVSPTVEVEGNPLETAIILNSDESYALGDGGMEIETISTTLHLLNDDIEISDYFNEEIEEAVKVFQEEHDLEPTGVVTGETTKKFNEMGRQLLDEIDPQYNRGLEILHELSTTEIAA